MILGLMMHTAHYHASSGAIYVYGGYRYYIDTLKPTDELWTYVLSDQRWYQRPHTPGQVSSTLL